MSRLRLRQNRFADAIEMAQLAYEERTARLKPSSRSVTDLQEIMAESLMGLKRTAEAEQVMQDLGRQYDMDGDEMDRLAMSRLDAMLRFHEGDFKGGRTELQNAWSRMVSMETTRTPLGKSIRRNLDMMDAHLEDGEAKAAILR